MKSCYCLIDLAIQTFFTFKEGNLGRRTSGLQYSVLDNQSLLFSPDSQAERQNACQNVRRNRCTLDV